jgi:hypothetical protein
MSQLHARKPGLEGKQQQETADEADDGVRECGTEEVAHNPAESPVQRQEHAKTPEAPPPVICAHPVP